MRIRFILFAAFAFVAIIPVVFFGVWPSSNALDREIEEVSDRHLLLARNLGAARASAASADVRIPGGRDALIVAAKKHYEANSFD